MNIKEFQLERYFARHEFTAKYLLSSSDCDGYGISEVLSQGSAEELRLWDQLKLGYTESLGHPALREAILQHYVTNDIRQVVVGSPGELNFIAMNVLLKQGDHAVVAGPCYQSLSEVVIALGGSMSYWMPKEDTWDYDIDDLQKLIKPETRAIVINFPHNPTGAYLKPSELNRLVELARTNDLWLFSDEMYHKLVITAEEELKPIADQYEKGISLWGTSKSFGMAGLRIGWLVSQDREFLKRVVAFKDYLSICNNAPGEVLAMIALNHWRAFVEPNVQKIKKNVALFQAFVDKGSPFGQFTPPGAGSTSFVPLNTNRPAREFSDQLVEQSGIMTVPAEMFNYPGNYVRIGFGRENFSEALDCLSNVPTRQLFP